ncbi:MAG: hypothetical protein Q9168_000463 [Polycauliona sp. 1 TL-2023]
MDTENAAEGVIGRSFILCPYLRSFDTAELIRTCDDCSNFFVYCCGCLQEFKNDGCSVDGKTCHHFRLIFTDGACSNNGQVGATAGIGVAMGTDEKWQESTPVTDGVDAGQKRTSQRAELLAALEGLKYLINADELYSTETASEGDKSWVIATDSEYVVNGITKWLPAWKRNKLRNSRNLEPANLDLFRELDATLACQEIKGVKIGFWHVPRRYNTIADALAKQAAQLGDPE